MGEGGSEDSEGEAAKEPVDFSAPQVAAVMANLDTQVPLEIQVIQALLEILESTGRVGP